MSPHVRQYATQSVLFATQRSALARFFRPSIGALLLVSCAAQVNPPAAQKPTERSATIAPILTPIPNSLGEATSSAVLSTLREDLDHAEASRLIYRYFRAIDAEDLGALARVLGDSAYHLTSPEGDRRAAIDFWRLRFAKFDYTQHQATQTFDLERLEYFDAQTLPLMGEGRGISGSIAPGEALVRVQSIVQAKNPLFGSEVVFLLRPQGASFEIAEVIEDYVIQ